METGGWMSRYAKMMRKGRDAAVRAIAALALTLAPMNAWAKADDAPPEETPARTYQLRDDYVMGRLDEDLVPTASDDGIFALLAHLMGIRSETLSDSGHTLYIKSTLYDAQVAGLDSTLDAIYDRDDWMDIIAGQYGSSVDLLDAGEGCGWYVALASTTIQNGLGSPTDHVFAAMDNDGHVIEEAVYDPETGLAYLPKSLFHEGGEDVPFGCQLQLLIPTDFTTSPACTIDVSVDCGDARVDAPALASVESSAYDVTTRIPIATPETAAYLSLDDIHLHLNGDDDEFELIEGQTASWDASSGILEIAASPQTILQADVSTDAPTLIELITEPACATPTSSLAYVPDVVFDSLDLDTLTPGRALHFDSWIDYWWANPDPNDFQWHACVATGSYCYSWINDPTSLYEYIAWADGADWNGVSSQDVSDFFVDANGSQAARNYFNYVFKFGSWTVEDQCFHSEKWPCNTPYDNGTNWVSFGLQCSHSRNPVGDGVSTDDGFGHMVMRVLDVNTEAARPYVVLGFVGPSVANQPGVGIYKFEILPAGDIEVVKTSSNPDASAANPLYSMEGIAYDVFSDAACTRLACSLTLDANGRGTSTRLENGTYYVRENAGSALGSGYAPSPAVMTAEVASGGTTQLNASDVPQTYGAGLLVRKTDAVTANATPQGDGALSGALFEVRHYPMLFSDAAAANGTAPGRTWAFATDESGCIMLDDAHLVEGDALYRTSAGEPCLPLGTITIHEVRAPDGYRLDDTVHTVALPASGTAETILFTQTCTVAEDIMRGGVLIEKRDAESGTTDPLGAASLDGTAFEVRNASAHAVCVDGVMFAPGEVVCTIASQGGSAATSSDALPFGTYELREVSAGSGYLASDSETRTFKIGQDGETVQLVKGDACFDLVKRGDIDLRKILQTDQSRLARVPFALTSDATGETHVLVTDDNGIVNTSATWHPHTMRTNANDWVLAASSSNAAEGETAPEGLILSADLDPGAGTWFGLTADGDMTAPDDARGALPFDSYTLTELRAEANEGLDLVSIKSIKITADGVSVPLGDVEDRVTPPPAITTEARSAADGTKQIDPDRSVRITDRIEYCNLTPGAPYTLLGTLMDAESGERITDDDGDAVRTEASITPASANGSCEVSFCFDASGYAGKRLVCFEQLRDDATSAIIARHEELSDAGQSIDVKEPRINTYASGDQIGAKEISLSTGPFAIEDAVSYSGLEAGAEYILEGTLMKRMEGPRGLEAQPIMDEAGTPLTCTVAFTPLSEIGTTSASFSVDPDAFEDGDELVVFETLSRDGRALVVHEDPGNDAQTVALRAPSIATHAFDRDSGESTACALTDIVISDEVRYEGLVAGKAYQLSGTIMVASEDESGCLIAHALTDAQGDAVKRDLPFTPGASSGSVTIDLPIDASSLSGCRLVVYEQLLCDGRLVAAHEDAAAESQTVWIEDASEPTAPLSPQALPRTGDGAPATACLLLALAAIPAALFSRWAARRKHGPTLFPRSCVREDAL